MGNDSNVSGLKKNRKIFGWIFLASLLVFVVSIMFGPTFDLMPGPEPMPEIVPEPAPEPPGDGALVPAPPVQPTPPVAAHEPAGIDTTVIVSAVSLLTSITSLIGFFSTTALAWRREKRESLSAELELKKKELELEKLRAELAKSKEGKNE